MKGPVFAFLAFVAVQIPALAQAPATPPAAATPKRPFYLDRATPAATGAAGNKDLIGEWEGSLTDGDGSKPSQRRGNMSLSITADKITSSGQGNLGDGTYKISGTGKLRKIDAEGTGGQYSGKHYEGIFTLEGDTLKWCSSNARPGSARPTELRTNVGSGHFLMILTRKK